MAHHLNGDAYGTETKPCNLQCIDLSNPDVHQSVALIKQACIDTGMFYAINHGVSMEVMNEAFAQSKKFFAMPLEEKKKLLWSKNHRGYQPPVQKDFVESFTTGIGALDKADDPTNIWPPAAILPGWRETIKKYQRETFNVGREISKLIALALDLNMDYFEQPKMLGEEGASICTILHYGDEENDSSKKKFGAAGHTDAGIITLVATDENLGLEICKDKHAKPQVWEHILPKKGAFIVNVGDMLERLSNDTFKSIFHRVIHRKNRYSIGVFLVPNYTCVIESVQTQKSKANPPKYPPTTFIDLLSTRYKEVTDGGLLNKRTIEA